jgi:hypothetical protein
MSAGSGLDPLARRSEGLDRHVRRQKLPRSAAMTIPLSNQTRDSNVGTQVHDLSVLCLADD